MACTSITSSQVEHALTLTEMINQGRRMWLTHASCFAVQTPFLVITFAWENLDQTVLQDTYLTTLYLLVYLAGETKLDLSSPLSVCFSILHCVSDQHSSSFTSSLAPCTNKQTNVNAALVPGGVVWNEMEFWEIRRVCSLLKAPTSSPNSVLWIFSKSARSLDNYFRLKNTKSSYVVGWFCLRMGFIGFAYRTRRIFQE
jgi:hypothetical protein